MFFGLFGKKDSLGALQPEAGTEIELEFVEGQHREVHITEVIRSDAGTLTLLPPHGDEYARILSPGREILAHLEREGKIGSFRTSVISFGGNPPAIVISQPRSVEWKEKTAQAQQRRNFVRFSTALPLAFSPSPGVDREGTTLDISGNGLSMVADLPLSVGKSVAVTLKLPDKPVKCSAQIVRCQQYKRTGTSKGKYEIALTFSGIEPKDQDRIVRYIFERQRQLRRRGLL